MLWLGGDNVSSKLILPLAIDSLLLGGVCKTQLTKPRPQSLSVLRQMYTKCNLFTLEKVTNLQTILVCVCADAPHIPNLLLCGLLDRMQAQAYKRLVAPTNTPHPRCFLTENVANTRHDARCRLLY